MFEPVHDLPDRGDGEHRHLLVRDGRVLVRIEQDTARALNEDEAQALLGETPGELVLGRHADITYWASELPAGVEPAGDHALEGLRSLHGRLSDAEWNIGGRATQILDWYRDHRYCGRCGSPMDRTAGERAMRCPVDGHTAYPRISPAVIVLVERDDGRALLGRSGRWNTPMYSTLAGFVEPGETLEETVQREILEEVGVQVGDITYFGSQPWPFPNSLMLGFNARWTGGDIAVDGVEIADAQWFAHDDLPTVPGPPSIANKLIHDWIDRRSVAGP